MARRFEFGPFVFDAQSGSLQREGRPVALNVRGAALLTALLEANGKPVTKAQLLDAAWPDLAVEESNLTVQIAALRRLMSAGSDGIDWVVTVPRVGYRFAAGTEHHADPAEAQTGVGAAVVVLPFEILGDAVGQYLADGITDDVIAALAQCRWLRVASRGVSFAQRNRPRDPRALGADLAVDFIVDGTIRRSSDHMRLSVHLTEVASGTTIWSEHFDFAEAELFAVQDAIAERIAGAIEPELLLHNGLQVTPHTGNLTAWDLVRQGTFNFHKVTQSTHQRARELFRRAAEIDPMLPEAHIWRARVNAGLVAYGWTDDPDGSAEEGLRAALQAIYLDSRNPYSHYALAIISAYTGRLEQAILAAERSTELSPSFALGHLALGLARLYSGNAVGAVEPLRRGLELNPHDPQNAVWFNLLMLAQFFSGDVEAATATGRMALKARPDWAPVLRMMACCHAAQENWAEARRMLSMLGSIQQRARDALDPFRKNNGEWADRLDALLSEVQRRADSAA
jgi:TolB-like protein